jgi:ubiquinone/menaquinone biosynthesis C-methylase UbiE
VSAPTSRLRLNLGSGNRPLDGYVNVDTRDRPGVDMIADATALPIPDGAAIEVQASSLLEHFRDPYAVLDEAHRVLAPDGVLVVRVPSPWSQAGLLDPTHVFLADLKQWRQILDGYFEHVRVRSEGVRYRDSKLLVALQYGAIHLLRMREYAHVWVLTASRKRTVPSRAYIPWWLEEKYLPVAETEQPVDSESALGGDSNASGTRRSP